MVRKGKLLSVCLVVATILFTGGCAGKSMEESADLGTKAVAGFGTADEMAASTDEIAPAEAESKNENGESEEAGAMEFKAEGPGGGLRDADEEKSGDKDIEAFAELIQESVADKDLEALADLTEFPLELEMADGEKMRFEASDEFLKQNPDLIFGDDLMVVIAGIDTATLKLQEDCVTMGEGRPCIRYEKREDGAFCIIEIKE